MNILDFRTWLKQQLSTRAFEVRAGFRNRIPTSDELDLLLVLNRLAEDTANISEHVYILFMKMLVIEKFRTNFFEVSHRFFVTIGPATAAHDANGLVRQLIIDSLQYDAATSRQRPDAVDRDVPGWSRV